MGRIGNFLASVCGHARVADQVVNGADAPAAPAPVAAAPAPVIAPDGAGGLAARPAFNRSDSSVMRRRVIGGLVVVDVENNPLNAAQNNTARAPAH